ncbi:MAG: hypothetical protein WAN50_02810 [Minisyncoccia bacterium]
MEKYSINRTVATPEIDHNSEEVIENIVLTYEDILKLLDNYREYGVLYHGTSSPNLSREVLPPDVTQIISERGRKKNLDKVFFTKEPKSAEIYAKRAASSYGGNPRVLRVVPMGTVTTVNEKQGTTVFHAPQAIVLSERLERILKDLSV